MEPPRPLVVAGALGSSTERFGATILLALVGELDAWTSSLVLEAVDRLEVESPRWLVVDLSRLCFIDAAGARAIAEACRQLAARTEGVEVRPGPPQIQRVFQLTGLSRTVPFMEDL